MRLKPLNDAFFRATRLVELEFDKSWLGTVFHTVDVTELTYLLGHLVRWDFSRIPDEYHCQVVEVYLLWRQTPTIQVRVKPEKLDTIKTDLNMVDKFAGCF